MANHLNSYKYGNSHRFGTSNTPHRTSQRVVENMRYVWSGPSTSQVTGVHSPVNFPQDSFHDPRPLPLISQCSLHITCWAGIYSLYFTPEHKHPLRTNCLLAYPFESGYCIWVKRFVSQLKSWDTQLNTMYICRHPNALSCTDFKFNNQNFV